MSSVLIAVMQVFRYSGSRGIEQLKFSPIFSGVKALSASENLE